MGLEWHNRKRSFDGKFAKRARGLENEAGYQVAQLHVRVAKPIADEVKDLALHMQMEISDLVEVALIKCIDDLYEIGRRLDAKKAEQTASNGTAAEEQPTTFDLPAAEQPSETGA